MSERPTCETCPYWEKWDEGSVGNCQRHAPIPSVERYAPELIGPHGATRASTFWPETDPSDACGDHPDFPAWLEERQATLPRP